MNERGSNFLPELTQASNAILRRIASDDGSIDAADRNACYPVGNVFGG
jgi:hypothetical protein